MWLVHPRVIYSTFDSNILLNRPILLSGTLDFEAFLTDVNNIARDGCTFDLSTDLNCVPPRTIQRRATKYICCKYRRFSSREMQWQAYSLCKRML